MNEQLLKLIAQLTLVALVVWVIAKAMKRTPRLISHPQPVQGGVEWSSGIVVGPDAQPAATYPIALA